MPNRTLKTEQDCLDFLSGLRLLGTGGGGPLETGLEMLGEALKDHLNLQWIDPLELPEEVYSCTAFGSGSLSKDNPKTEADIDRLGEKLGLKNKYGHRAIEVAIRELETYTGTRIGALVPVELGAANTPGPLVTAARMGLPVIDGDYSGRAVPQDMQTTYFLKGIKTYPATIVDYWGNVLILKEAANAEMGERIGKLLSVASHGVVYFATILLSAKETRETVVPHTLTQSLDLGKAVHQACAAGLDPIRAAVECLDGWRLFDGEVTAKEFENREGGSVGKTHIRGTGAYAGHTLDVYFFNENHVAWLDGKPFVFSPDLIILANSQTGEGYTNTEIKEGDPVSVLGAKVYPAFRSPLSLQYFGPRYWGVDCDYVPVEEAVKGFMN